LNSTNTKQSIIDAYNRITIVDRAACYVWFYTGQWFSCGFLYEDKKYGELIVIQFNQGYNYIVQCIGGQININQFNTTVI
jgi:hypothetical protein